MRNGMPMKFDRPGCPKCGYVYSKLYRTSYSTCPKCHEKICTDLWMVRAIETIVAAPFFWMLATALRMILNDSTGIISYSLLIIPAWVFDLFIAQRFVTARSISDEKVESE